MLTMCTSTETNKMKKRKMKNRNTNLLSFAVVAICGLLLSGCDSDNSQEVTTLNNLVWADEFNSNGAPDPENWSFETGTGQNGWGNNELQYYTNRPENINVGVNGEGEGFLRINILEEPFEGSNYTSARIITKGKFEQQYGRFEARMKLPWGQGLWPAFWMLGADIDTNPWPAAGEIDVMENVGQEPTIIFGSVHGPGYSGGESVGKDYDFVNERVDTDFHIYGIEWGPGFINYYVDDVLYNQITPNDVDGEWVFDKPFFLLLNVAVGGNLPGSPNEQTVFPQQMLVDYVRVYN